MAKKQSRRSVSLSRTTYERLRSYCETNQVSMSQFVEGRIGDFLGGKPIAATIAASAPAPTFKRPEVVAPVVVAAPRPVPAPVAAPVPAPVAAPAPAPASAPMVVRPAPAPAPVAATPAPAPVRIAPSAPNPGQRPAPAKPVKIDEAAAKRAADRIFTF